MSLSETNKAGNGFLAQDLSIIFFSLLLTLVLVKTQALSTILSGAVGLKLFGSFIAGMFFTSVFTTVPAIVTLGEISRHNSIFLTALFGALGALVGDLIIFSFIKDKLSEHLNSLLEHTNYWKRVKHILKLKYFRWGTFLLGGLIIASPFPDELGISLMGLSKMKTKSFILISVFFNFIGILLIGLVAKSF
jgi:hypothetical protein